MSSLNSIVKFTSYFLIPFGILLFFHSHNFLKQSITDSVLTTSAALLGMLPKGLVLLTSVSLAVGVIKLSKQKVLIQELFCIETLSRVDTLCLDKTGTLTKGQMAVTDVILLDRNILPVSINTAAASFFQVLDDNNSTSKALKEYFKSDKTLKSTGKTPFSSARKWSSVTFESVGTIIIGAPEILLKDINYKLPDEVIDLEASGSRILLLAFSRESVRGELPKELYPAAVIILQDEVRDNAKEILDLFHQQGVDIKIISGDNPITVAAISKKAGLSENAAYVDGRTLETKEQIYEAAKKYTIFGRVMPDQKKELICALKEQGHTVAMTGDGVNDVLALKEADCSIAVASGSDAARQISQLVLLNSDFSALPNVVMEGRRVVNNITRTSSLFLVKTIFSFLLSLFTVFFSMPYPYIPIQLTLISMCAEGIPSFLLAFEKSSDSVCGNFLSTVLTRAFPSALIIVFYTIIVNVVLTPMFHIPQLESITLCFYLMGFAWLMQLYNVCLPFNKMRGALWITMTGCFYLAAYFLRDIFSLGILSNAGLMMFILLASLCYPMQTLLYKILSEKKFKNRVFS
jgi:cation-transporting P-type ATPase E